MILTTLMDFAVRRMEKAAQSKNMTVIEKDVQNSNSFEICQFMNTLKENIMHCEKKNFELDEDHVCMLVARIVSFSRKAIDLEGTEAKRLYHRALINSIELCGSVLLAKQLNCHLV